MIAQLISWYLLSFCGSDRGRLKFQTSYSFLAFLDTTGKVTNNIFPSFYVFEQSYNFLKKSFYLAFFPYILLTTLRLCTPKLLCEYRFFFENQMVWEYLNIGCSVRINKRSSNIAPYYKRFYGSTHPRRFFSNADNFLINFHHHEHSWIAIGSYRRNVCKQIYDEDYVVKISFTA